MNRPLALVCYICGRQFGTKSLAIHVKTCQKKWENQENHKPPKQRRPCPQPPPGFKELMAKDNITKKDIIAFNNGSFNTFLEEALVQCQYCGRKFNQKSLIPHQKACQKSPMIHKPYISKQQKVNMPLNKNLIYTYENNNYPNQEVNQNLVPCKKCGRTFNSDRVAKHQKVCKQLKQPVKKQQEKYTNFKNTSFNPKPSVIKKQEIFGQKPSKWRVQHQEFQNAIKAMRQIKRIQETGGNIRDLPPPPPSNYDHYIPCKYCGRKYAPDVAQRHIPKCANIINKPGGIKPSKIQEKYIGSTGVKKPIQPTTINKNYMMTNSSAIQKPKIQITKSNIYSKPKTKQQPIYNIKRR